MKRFRSITILTLTAIAIMVALNIVYLHGLYISIKQQSMQTATEALRRADILEIISRMKSTSHGSDDSFIRLTLMIEGEKSKDGSYNYPNLLKNIDRTMSDYFHLIAANSPEMPRRNLAKMEQIYRKELETVGLNPELVLLSDSVLTSGNVNKLWDVSAKGLSDEPLISCYISPLNGYILSRMAGIIISSAAILILMSFLIWYLLHWVGKLRSIEQMKDDFTHNMTHELKTPVAVAYSAADSMLRYYDRSDDHRNKKLLAIILQRLNYLSGMIENILSMSMERFKTMNLNIEKVELLPLVEEVVSMTEMKADKPLTISILIKDKIFIETDPQHFGNIISNLLENAIKYSADSVTITITGNSHQISISDNGIGISKENLPLIFDKFYRVTNGNRYEVGGYGLGLYYVKQIVSKLGWSISVTSEENKGSTFTIKFSSNEKR